MMVPTIKVKPWSKDQGDFVEINECDFDPAIHQRFEPGKNPLDHDGDGESGGSVKGYHSTAAKGARKRKVGCKKAKG